MADDLEPDVDLVLSEATETLTRLERRRENPKVACPLCGCRMSRVLDSRDLEAYAKDYKRRRVCLGKNCGAIYVTQEVALRVELQQSA